MRGCSGEGFDVKVLEEHREGDFVFEAVEVCRGRDFAIEAVEVCTGEDFLLVVEGCKKVDWPIERQK